MRDYLSAKVQYLIARENLVYNANAKLNCILETIIRNPESTSVSKSLESILRSSVWQSYETEVESWKSKIKERVDDLIAADVEKRRMENSAAQNLFIALAEHVGKTSGYEILQQLILNSCEQPRFGVLPTSLVQTSIPSVNRSNSASDPMAFNLEECLGSGYDLADAESEISKMLTSQLPTSANEMNNEGVKSPISWRSCPSSEIEAWKSERLETSQAYSKLLAQWEEEKHPRDDFGLANENIDRLAEAADQLNRLQSQIASAEDHTKVFLSRALSLIKPMISPNETPTTVRSLEEALMEGLGIMGGSICALNKKLCAKDKVLKGIIEVLDSVVTYFPDIRNDYGNIMQEDVVKVLLLIATRIKAIHCAKDKDARDILHLHKAAALKDKKLREAETDLIKARELKGAREGKLSQENRKLDSELSNARHELEKARKEPDYVREQFSNKMQKLHDKIRALQNDVEQQSKAKNILELDNEAMTKDLESKCTKIERQKEQLKKFREEFIKVKDERDQLRSKQPFNEPDAHAHVKNLENNIRELEEDIRSLNNAKATSDETIRELEKDLRNLNNAKATGEETIRELLQQEAEQKKENSNLRASLTTMEEIQNTTMDQLEEERQKGSTNVNRDENAIISKLEKELADERAKLKLAEGRDIEFATLQQGLAAERAKSKRLEERLGPFLAAAVAAGSL
jgi:hypothetical protein